MTATCLFSKVAWTDAGSVGLDGSGLTAFIQYPFLASEYEIKCLAIPLEDRSTFMQLIHRVTDQIKVGPSLFALSEVILGNRIWLDS